MSRFPRDIIDAAQASQRKWGPPAAVTLAQWAVESAYGTRMPPGSNNPFGIKAVGDEPHVKSMTHEVVHGRTESMIQNFRKFESVADAFDAHGKLLATSHHYKAAMEQKNHPKAFANALTGVYATDPAYGAKLVKIMDDNNLYQFDALARAPNPQPGQKEKPMPTISQPSTPAVPTIIQPVKVDPGSAMASLIEQFRPEMEKLADTAEDFAFSKIPFGTMVEEMVGPHLARQYLDTAMTQAEKLAASGIAGAFNKPDVAIQMATNAMVAGETWLSHLGIVEKISSWINNEAKAIGFMK